MSAKVSDSDGCLDGAQSMELELVRRNREIAQVRDLLRCREGQLQEWRSRHGELQSRLFELNSETAKLRSRVRDRDEIQVTAADNACQTCTMANISSMCCQTDTNIGMDGNSQTEPRPPIVMDGNSQTESRSPIVMDESSQTAPHPTIVMDGNSQTEPLAIEEAVPTAREHALAVLLASERAEAVAELAARKEELQSLLHAESCARWAAEADRGRFVSQQSMMLDSVEVLQAALLSSKEELQNTLLERDELANQVDHAMSELHARKAMVLEQTAILAVPVEPSAVIKLEAYARILQTENSVLRAEAANNRRRTREMEESVAMAAEDARSRRAEDAALIVKLQLQLEESRRARSLEMKELVKSMCQPTTKGSPVSGRTAGSVTLSVCNSPSFPMKQGPHYIVSAVSSVILRQHRPGGC